MNKLLHSIRLDEIFFVDLPSAAERLDIFRIHLIKRNRAPENFDLPLLARLSKGFSGSEIEQVIISALYDSFEAGRELQTSDMITAIRQSVPLSHTMREAIDALRQWAQTRARSASSDTPDVVLTE